MPLFPGPLGRVDRFTRRTRHVRAPALADQGITVSALTAEGQGGPLLANTGDLVSGASIASGDDSDHWQISSDGRLTPTAAGDTADLDGAPYSLGISATNIAGSDTATITVSAAAGIPVGLLLTLTYSS